MPIPTILEPESIPVPPPLSKSKSASGTSRKSARSKAGLESGGHSHKRVFVGPLPEKVIPLPDSSSTKGKKKRRLHLLNIDNSDEDGIISRIIRDHAFEFFLQEGGKEEDWEESREQSVREEMLRRWRETEWGAVWHRRQSKDAKQSNQHWIGGSFEVGNILGVNILQEPAESIRDRISNRSAPSSRMPGTSSSHLPFSIDERTTNFYTPDDGTTSFFAAEPPTVSILRPTLGVEEDDSRRAQSDFAARPALEIATQQAKSDTYVAVLGKQRAVHYAPSPVRSSGEDSPAPPSEVLERSASQLPATSALAMSAPPTLSGQFAGDVVMRDRMLVRVGYTESESLGPLFDEETSRKTRGIRYHEWAEYMVIFRNKSIHFYEPHNVPGTKWLTGSKYRLAYVVPTRQSAKTRLSLYSFVDLTWCLTCAPTSVHHDSKTISKLRRTKEGTNIFICKVKTRSRSADWMWAIWRALGGLLPPSLEIRHPSLGTRVKMEMPGVEAPEMFTRENIKALCLDSLRRVQDWKELIDLQLSEGKELELVWRLGTLLDWVWLDTDVMGEPRECAVLCGLAMQQSVSPPYLEVRLAQHFEQHLILKNGTRLPQPPSIEGYLERIRPNSQTKHLMYLVTHDGNLFSLASEKAHPPSPMGIGQEESAETLKLAEVQRGTEQILGASGVTDLRSILTVRRAFQPIAPLSHDVPDPVEDQSYMSHTSHLERCDSDDEDEGGEEGLRVAQDKPRLRMKRSFELLLKNGHIIRFEAHSRKIAVEWIERLRALIEYWKQRHRIDASDEMDLAQAYRPRLTVRRHICRNDSEIAPEAPVDASAPMPSLSNLYNWCVLQGCKPVLRGGKLFVRRGLYGQYKFVQLFLLAGHLVQFQIMPGSALHLAMYQNINLADAYVCSGYFAILTLPSGEHTSHDPLPRRYQDGLETDDPDEDTMFMLWYHPHRTAVNVALEAPHNDEAEPQPKQNTMSVPSLSTKRKVAVFRCRNKLERDAWCWALNCEIEKLNVHASRDKILLEGNESGGDDDGDEDEVFGLDLSDDEDMDDEDGQEEDNEDTVGSAKTKLSKSKSKKAKSKVKASSDEEDSDEDETWGRGRSAYYSSNAAQLDSDDEEGNELEEQEAKRLQAKARDTMGDDDFGLDDATAAIVIYLPEDIVPVEDATPLDPKALIRHLEKTSPETLALARDWEDTAESLMKTRQKVATLEATDPDSLSLGMVHFHYQALLAYTTALAFYLHLRSSEKYARRPDLLRTHPVMARLLTLKQSLTTLEELDFAASDSEVGLDEEGSDVDLMMDAEQLWKLKSLEGLDDDELQELLKDADLPEEPEVEPRPKKKRKTSSSAPALPIFDLVEPDFTASTSATQRRLDSSIDAYGEATTLQHADAADKSARRKSLRFHTSRIESASARRQGARNNAVGGDDDIPYRDTRKQAAKVPQSQRGQGGDDLDESDPLPKTADAEDAEGYYDLVQRNSKLKKEKKKADYEAALEATRPDYEEEGADGPRSLTRAILKNKGLTPRRPKSVRNPRVKKREKFRKANIKVSSQKAVYKGGLASTGGRYDGERSGISKVVKSTPLG
ncbi:hypothetical protein R3P38DRAFT_2605963 [Favolaschia claudopus]|uniref:PH domain-containing protein n=1 Tax=Favolaschia claudopus TaxID=2862362 RepID=A0AAW0DCC6_9AGAR